MKPGLINALPILSPMSSTPEDPIATRAILAITLWAVDPALGGIWLRAKPSPARSHFLRLVRSGFDARFVKLNHTVSDEALFGGLDVGATLTAGKPIFTSGLLNAPNPHLFLTQAETCTSAFTARIATACDRGAVLLAIDEGGADDGLAPALQDRLAFHVDIEGLRYNALSASGLDQETIARAQARLKNLSMGSDIEPVTELAQTLGVTSVRAIHLTLRAARAHAAFCDRGTITQEDISVGAGLVLGPRTNVAYLPEETEEQTSEEETNRHTRQGQLEDQVLESIRTNLPSAMMMAFLQNQRSARQLSGAGAGMKQKGNRRGRPIAPRPGNLSGGNRLDVLSTIRRAIPWQPLRPKSGVIAVRKEDFAIKRFEEKSDRLIVFSVDASGSSAAKRLGEAKGAVETLLGEAYSRRDHVAVIAFRKDGAEVLLPPTRSLVQAKRRLGALPGGGGTPLASGLHAGFLIALAARKKGMSPSLVLLSDGGANVAMDGQPGRPQAQADAEDIARHFAAQRIPCLTIDTGRRPDPTLQRVSETLGGTYFPLPHGQDGSLSDTLMNAMGAA